MREPEQFTLELAPAAIASITVEWSGAERMLARVRGLVGVSAGANPLVAGRCCWQPKRIPEKMRPCFRHMICCGRNFLTF